MPRMALLPVADEQPPPAGSWPIAQHLWTDTDSHFHPRLSRTEVDNPKKVVRSHWLSLSYRRASTFSDSLITSLHPRLADAAGISTCSLHLSPFCTFHITSNFPFSLFPFFLFRSSLSRFYKAKRLKVIGLPLLQRAKLD